MLRALIVGGIAGAVTGSLSPFLLWLIAPKLGEWKARRG